MACTIDAEGLSDVGKHRKETGQQFLVAELGKTMAVRRTELALDTQPELPDAMPGHLFAVTGGMRWHTGGEEASESARYTLVPDVNARLPCDLLPTASAVPTQTGGQEMLRSMNEMTGYALQAEDGEIGRCKDFLLDDPYWTVRYMVADTGSWLPGRQVLISPLFLRSPDWASQLFPVNLTKEQVEEAPKLQEHAPVHRQYEVEYHTFYGLPYYWAGTHSLGPVQYPAPLYDVKPVVSPPDSKPDDCLLRSANELVGYHIRAVDGEIGHVEEFILDDESWTVRYIVVDTRNWLPGKKVLVPPAWIESADWLDKTVAVDLTRGQVERSPEYDPSAPVNREYEKQLYNFYGRLRYWE